jgi:DNA-binding transcriptional MerR regulator
MKDGYSTRQAATKLGISLSTLNKFIGLGQIPEPPVTQVAGMRVRLWTDADIERVRQILPKIANGRKTRHQKGKTAQPRAAVPHKTRKPKK